MGADLTLIYTYAINLFSRFMLWHFEIFGVTVHVYSLVIFALLAVLLIKFIDILRGV